VYCSLKSLFPYSGLSALKAKTSVRPPSLDIKSLYPQQNLQKFNALRRKLDPDGMFINPFLAQQGLFS
jgi:hypothetical protein